MRRTFFSKKKKKEKEEELGAKCRGKSGSGGNGGVSKNLRSSHSQRRDNFLKRRKWRNPRVNGFPPAPGANTGTHV